MRRPLLGLAVVLGVSLLAPSNRAHAQAGLGPGLGADPFSLYFGFYLPHQAAIAAQATPLDTINAAAAARAPWPQPIAGASFDPISPFGGDESFDQLGPYSRRSGPGANRMGRPHIFPSTTTSAMTGRGLGTASAYYNRTAGYYLSLRSGHGPNRNLAVTRRPTRGTGMPNMGGGMGMPGMGPR